MRKKEKQINWKTKVSEESCFICTNKFCIILFCIICTNKFCIILFQVFQKRFNGSVDFDRNWTDNSNGFGSLDGEFWYNRFLWVIFIIKILLRRMLILNCSHYMISVAEVLYQVHLIWRVDYKLLWSRWRGHRTSWPGFIKTRFLIESRHRRFKFITRIFVFWI